MASAITFYKIGDFLILKYDRAEDSDWVDEKLIENGLVTIRKTLTFDASQSFTSSYDGLLDEEDQSREFVFGRLESDYFRIGKSCLDLKYDLFIQKDTTPFLLRTDEFRLSERLIKFPMNRLSSVALLREQFRLRNSRVYWLKCVNIYGQKTTAHLNRFWEMSAHIYEMSFAY
jgi:hypothetical protein